jgi:hypothetical protein
MLNDVEALSDDAARELARRYAGLVAGLAIPAGDPLLVLPNAEFFPDKFTADRASLERLVARMQGYAALEALTIDVEVTGELAGTSASGCGTGGCGSGACEVPAPRADAPRIARTEAGYRLLVPADEIGSPIVLTARLATSLGAVALVERHPEGAERVLDGTQAEMAAVALGFGVLLLEASYMYRKACGGPSVACATGLGLGELAWLFALSVAREAHSLRAALAELGTTQRALVKEAASLAAESRTLVRLLQDHPARAARGDFRLRQGGSLWSRLFSRRERPQTEEARLEAALAALENGASVDEVAKLVGPSESR